MQKKLSAQIMLGLIPMLHQEANQDMCLSVHRHLLLCNYDGLLRSALVRAPNVECKTGRKHPNCQFQCLAFVLACCEGCWLDWKQGRCYMLFCCTGSYSLLFKLTTDSSQDWTLPERALTECLPFCFQQAGWMLVPGWPGWVMKRCHVQQWLLISSWEWCLVLLRPAYHTRPLSWCS